MSHPRIPLFFAGARQDAHSTRTSPVYNPSTGAVAAQVPLGDATDIEAVIADAASAARAWGERSSLDRSRVMFKWRELCLAHADELAHLISSEHGKVFSDARGELQRGLEVVEFSVGIPHLMKGEFSDQVSRGIDMHSLRQPLGVVAAITPFNFPAMVPLWMLGPALATGNAVVFKPSERDPSTGVRLAELFVEAGAPPGVLNVLHGDAEAVNALCTDPRIQAVSFVGSTPIAQHVYETAAKHGKRVQAMGGAKNHLVVLPDADLNMAVEGLMGSAYGSAGERCMAISVAVVVGDETADALVARLADRVKALKVGASAAEGMDMGPLVTGTHRDKIKGYIDLGVKEGATLVVDGREHPAQASGGFFLGGSLFDHVTKDMTIYREEIFGPVLCIVRVQTADEALALCDEHQFGNGVAIFTRSGGAAREFAHRVQCGMVGINVPIPVPLAFYSFGGWKASAFGDHNQHGMDGVRFFTKLKTVTTRWPQGVDAASFSMPVLR
ncbi:CoA-acylating methylmalonate-semialdehyde dehydrogenase [Gemmatimonas aurantiaca]|uniref:CoA-acylating methylmalonate-semialdehyde dehydrogenase n=1 Tax=Gemmatimonas aurantiaca TaxID=173480 RepID=UPI00301CDB29